MAKNISKKTNSSTHACNTRLRINSSGDGHEFNMEGDALSIALKHSTGIADVNVALTLIGQASSLFGGDNIKRNLNQGIALLSDIDPRDALEGMLATQIVTVHNMAMEMSKRAMHPSQSSEVASGCMSHAIKLMNTYKLQIETLQKYRNKGQQTIQVQHVNVEAGGQAIVGNVTGGGG